MQAPLAVHDVEQTVRMLTCARTTKLSVLLARARAPLDALRARTLYRDHRRVHIKVLIAFGSQDVIHAHQSKTVACDEHDPIAPKFGTHGIHLRLHISVRRLQLAKHRRVVLLVRMP